MLSKQAELASFIAVGFAIGCVGSRINYFFPHRDITVSGVAPADLLESERKPRILQVVSVAVIHRVCA